MRIGRIEDTFLNICRGCYWTFHWYTKHRFLKAIGKRPLYLWEAEERFEGEYAPGLGVYMSDGIYQRLCSYATMRGYIPLWIEKDARGNDRYAHSGKRVGLFKR
jgi:hypothetical protein